jgi:transposase
MATRRRFSNEFKRMVVEQCLSGHHTQAQLLRHYDLSHNMLYRWRQEYESGMYNRESEAEVKAKDTRIRELEQLVGRLTLENEFLKRAAEYARQQQSDDLSIISGPRQPQSKRGAQ